MISVIVCTYNRAKSLEKTLESFLGQKFSSDVLWELIVVDNNSKDNTKQLVEYFLSKFQGKLRYVLELTQGLSFARNKGIQKALGDIVAFTDDDCFVDKNWVNNIYKSFEMFQCVGIGGQVLVNWPNGLPPWFKKGDFGLDAPVGMHDHGEQVFLYTRNMGLPIGANMSFKKAIFEKYGNFDTKAGFIGGKKTFGAGEDTEFVRRLLKNGEKVLYVPSIKVTHNVLSERLNKKYIRKWFFQSGKKIALSEEYANSSRFFMKIPFWLFKEFFYCILDYIKNILKFNSKNRFYSEVQVIKILGGFYEIIKLKAYAHRN